MCLPDYVITMILTTRGMNAEESKVKSSQVKFYLYSAISQQMLSHDTLQIEQV